LVAVNQYKISPEIIGISKHRIKPDQIDNDAKSIIKKLNKGGFKGYIVGGFVRDSILGLKPKDCDVVTNATPEEIKNLLPRTRIIGKRFKIVHARSGRNITEISTFRSSNQSNTKKSSEGLLLRDNNYGNIEDDVFRRDFTINALYLDVEKMEIIDFVEGFQDIKNGDLKSIGDSFERFKEDPVRILRAIRFKAKLNLNIDSKLGRDMKKLSYLLKEISSGRKYEETLKLLLTGNSQSIMSEMQNHDLLDYLLPLTKDFLNSKKDKRFIFNVLKNTDERYKRNKTLTPSFLFAVLLWPALINKTGSLNSKKIKIHNISRAANLVLKKHNQDCFIPARIQQSIKETWELQAMLLKIPEKSKIALKHKRFRAGYDFLLLREKSGENLGGAGQWWTKKIAY
jgi:poly(A) polymerase